MCKTKKYYGFKNTIKEELTSLIVKIKNINKRKFILNKKKRDRDFIIIKKKEREGKGEDGSSTLTSLRTYNSKPKRRYRNTGKNRSKLIRHVKLDVRSSTVNICSRSTSVTPTHI